jgi:hypothetical protein
MATKYGSRKKHNAGTVRTSTNNRGGSRTRKTTTVKTGNYTRSRSVNRNGTVRLTTTHKSPSGFITRAVSTIGSKPSKPKAPKFIKAKPFKAPKMKSFKAPKIRSSSSSGLGSLFSVFGSGSSKRSNRKTVEIEEVYDGESSDLNWWQWILLILASPFLFVLKLLWPLISVALYYSAVFIGLTLLAVVLLLMMGH